MRTTNTVGAPLDWRIGGVVRRPLSTLARRNRLARSGDGGSDRVHARPEWRYARRLRRIGNPRGDGCDESQLAWLVGVCRKRKPGRRRAASAVAGGSPRSRFGSEMTQDRESHDGLRCEFLRQFHAALVGCTIGFVEIDVGQLLARRSARRLACSISAYPGSVPSRSLGVRKGGDREAGPRVKSCSCWTASSACDQAIMSLSRRLSSSAADADSSIPS